ncbi:MAG: TetR/AcrR family transcriptional regulator [Rickettsiales bacterium]|nr:TetR/AcrR family transcriptional regulator [Rickettsiales bacterium]
MPTPHKNATLIKRGRPVNGATRDAIIKVATQLFMQQGLQRTTMDSIARALNISKLTLYSRFPNKDALFTAVITAKCVQYIPDDVFENFGAQSLADDLFAIGHGLLRLLISDDAMNMERMLMGEARHKKNLTRLFYEAGPHRVKSQISHHLEALHEKGTLNVPDPILATHFFTSLFKGSDICLRIAMQIPPKPTQTEIRDYCRKAVSMFIAAHQPIHKSGKPRSRKSPAWIS